MSALLRRDGIRTVRVTTSSHARSIVTSRLTYDRFEVLSSGHELRRLLEIIGDENVVDIQYVESLRNLVSQVCPGLRPEVAERILARIALIDKFAASRLFASHGVSTPEVIPASEATPDQVVERLSLPVVAKARVGNGGDNATIASDLATLRTAASLWEENPEFGYYERYVEGEKLNYGAAESANGIVQELAYRVIDWIQPTGTALEIETIDDRELMAFGRQVIAVAGCTGLINPDIIRDRDGKDWLIDFNARVFGGAANFMIAALDISQGYLAAIDQRQDPPSALSPKVGVSIRVFPSCLASSIATENLSRTLRAFLRDAGPYVKWLGLRYWLAEALTTIDASLVSRRRHR